MNILSTCSTYWKAQFVALGFQTWSSQFQLLGSSFQIWAFKSLYFFLFITLKCLFFLFMLYEFLKNLHKYFEHCRIKRNIWIMFYLQSEVQTKPKQEFLKGPFTWNLLTISSSPSKGCWRLIVYYWGQHI